MTQVKICGLSTPETLTAAIECGADFVGLVFYPPSPRHIEPEVAQYLASFIPENVKIVGLFVDPTDELLDTAFYHVPNLMIQLHGNETIDRVKEIKEKYKAKIIKSISIETRTDLQKADDYQNIADWILFDAKGEKLPGGNGIAFDWSILEGYTRHTPFLLAGGLTPENVAEAIETVKPDAVDVSSGVESAPGMKDSDKIRSFILTSKSA